MRHLRHRPRPQPPALACVRSVVIPPPTSPPLMMWVLFSALDPGARDGKRSTHSAPAPAPPCRGIRIMTSSGPTWSIATPPSRPLPWPSRASGAAWRRNSSSSRRPGMRSARRPEQRDEVRRQGRARAAGHHGLVLSHFSPVQARHRRRANSTRKPERFKSLLGRPELLAHRSLQRHDVHDGLKDIWASSAWN